jgi:hypothetical protein
MKEKIKLAAGDALHWIVSRPLAMAVIAALALSVTFYTITKWSDWSVDRGSANYEKKDAPLETRSQEKQIESIVSEADANVASEQAEREQKRLETKKTSLKEKKKRLETLTKNNQKPADPNRYPVGDDARVPSAVESCRRAIRLGIPCDESQLIDGSQPAEPAPQGERRTAPPARFFPR